MERRHLSCCSTPSLHNQLPITTSTSLSLLLICGRLQETQRGGTGLMTCFDLFCFLGATTEAKGMLEWTWQMFQSACSCQLMRSNFGIIHFNVQSLVWWGSKQFQPCTGMRRGEEGGKGWWVPAICTVTHVLLICFAFKPSGAHKHSDGDNYLGLLEWWQRLGRMSWHCQGQRGMNSQLSHDFPEDHSPHLTIFPPFNKG